MNRKIPAPTDEGAAPDAQVSPIADFETSLEELEGLVARLEQGEQPLEQSLKDFERGVALFRRCEQALQHAELRVQQLLDPADPTSRRPFEPDPA